MIDNQIMDIPMAQILMDQTLNCRDTIAPIDVQDLALDIEKNGLLSPVIVQEYGKEYFGRVYKYRLIAGFRRFTAHKVLKAETIKATLISANTEANARIINLRENLIRKDLNIMEEAKALEHLVAFGMIYKDIAKEVGKSVTWVQVRIKLLSLPQEIQEQAANGVLSQYHIKDIAKLPTKELQFEAVRKIKDAKLKGERVPNIRKKHGESATVKRIRKRNEIMAMMDHIQESIGNNFGTRCLAWSSGEISDYQLYLDIKRIAKERGIAYTVAMESVSSMKGM